MATARTRVFLDDLPSSQQSLYQSEFPFLDTGEGKHKRPSTASETDTWRREIDTEDDYHLSDPRYQAGDDSRDISKASQKNFGTTGPRTPMARFDTDGNVFDVRAGASKNTTNKLASSLLGRIRSDFGSRTTSDRRRLQRADSSPNLHPFQRSKVRSQGRKPDESWTGSMQFSPIFPPNGRQTKSEDHHGHNSGHKSKHRSKKHRHKDHKKKKKKRSSQHKSNENDLKSNPDIRVQQKIAIITDRERSSSDPILQDLKKASSAFTRSRNDVRSPKFGGRLNRTSSHHRSTNSGSMLSRSLNDLDRPPLSVDTLHKAASLGSSTIALPLSPAPPSRLDTKSKASSRSHRNKKPREKLPVLNPRDVVKPLVSTGDTKKLKSHLLLRFAPSDEIPFALEINKMCLGRLLVENTSQEETVAFKVKTNNPKRYLVRPAMSIIKPSTMITIQFIIEADKVNNLFPRVSQNNFGAVKRKKDKFLVKSCVLEEIDMSTADNEKSLQSMWSLPRWKRKTADKRFSAKHFKMVLVSSSDSDDDDDDSSESSSDTSKSQPRVELAPRASAGKSKDSSGWVKAGSKILSMVRDSSVDSPKGSKTTPPRRRDDLPATVLSLVHKGKKHTRGHDSQTTKHTSHRLSVTSFSSDENSSDDEKEVRVASVDSERIPKRGSSPGLRLSIKAGKFANAIAQDDEIDILFSDHLAPWKWQRGNTIGQGQYGTVFLASRESDGQKMAMKEVELLLPRSVLSTKPGFVQSLRKQTQKHGGTAEQSETKTPETLLSLLSLVREISVMKTLQHPNIVQYLAFEKKSVETNDVTDPKSDRNEGDNEDFTKCKLRLFMEFVGGGSIAGLLRRLGAFQVGVVVAYTKHILAGLKYLHSKGIAHRDVKGANLLLTKTGTIKLADFGTATTALQLLTPRSRRHHIGDSFSKFLLESAMGTPHWMAPEVARGMGRSLRENIVWEKADIWSLGCTVVEMLTGHAPWYQKFSNPIAIIVHLAKNGSPPEYPEGLSDVGCQFLDLCFQRETTARPTVNQLLNQPFVRDRKAQIFPPSKLQVMSPIYMQRKTHRRPSTRSLLDKETVPSLPGFSSPGLSSPDRGNSKSNADLPKDKSPKQTLTTEADTIIENTPVATSDSRHATLTQSNSTTTHVNERHTKKKTSNDIKKQKVAVDDDKFSTATNTSTPTHAKAATVAAESITGTSAVDKEAVELNADQSETADDSAVNFQADLAQLNTYPDAWQTKHAAEIEEIFAGTFRQWLFGHLKWVCKQAISHYLMTEEQSDYLLEDQYAEWDLLNVPSSPLLLALQSASDVANSLLEKIRAGVGLQPLEEVGESDVSAANASSPTEQVAAVAADGTRKILESTKVSSIDSNVTVGISAPQADCGLVSFVWDHSQTWIDIGPDNSNFLVEWLGYARENLMQYDWHVPTWLHQLRRRALYTARLQQLYERLEYFYNAFNDIWKDRDEERAKILSTVLAAPSASMRRWCAYPFGDACALLNAAYRQIEGQVQYIQELTEGLWYEVEKQATAPFAYAYVCAEGWAEEEHDDQEAEDSELKKQTVEDHLDQLDTESDVVIDSTTVWRCGVCKNKFNGSERNCWQCDRLIVYPDETWHENYFSQYYELVQKQQEAEYNYGYDYSFANNSEDFDETLDEDEVELLPPATPSKDGDDTIKDADSEAIAEDDTQTSVNVSINLEDSYNYDEMTEEQYYDWYYGLGEYAVEEEYQEGNYDESGDAIAAESNGTNTESAAYEGAEGSGLYDYDYSDSEYYQHYLGGEGYADGEGYAPDDGGEQSDFFPYQEQHDYSNVDSLETSADQMEFSREFDESVDYGEYDQTDWAYDQVDGAYDQSEGGYDHTETEYTELDASVESYELQEEVIAVVLADYNAVDESEMTIRREDVIRVLRKDPSGWWEGECNGTIGWFPSNYVQTKHDLFTISEEPAQVDSMDGVDSA